MKKLNKKGFTLIELLAVIVILGVLMLVAIPAVTRYINDSKRKTFISNASTILDAAVNQANLDTSLITSSTCYIPVGGSDTHKIETEKTLPTGYTGFVGIDKSGTTPVYYLYLTDGTYKIAGKTSNQITSTMAANDTGTIGNAPASGQTGYNTKCYQ